MIGMDEWSGKEGEKYMFHEMMPFTSLETETTSLVIVKTDSI